MKEYKIVFWDFDGVIKDSVSVKTSAFENLFKVYGEDIGRRVREHHIKHSGVSRFEKIPLYLEWSGLPSDSENVQVFCDKFSAEVLQAVVDSEWVPGVREYLEENAERQYFVLTTATPQDEIETILDTIEIRSLFRRVYGAPHSKAAAIETVMNEMSVDPSEACMVGDAEADHAAATGNGIEFILRCTPLNTELQELHKGSRFSTL